MGNLHLMDLVACLMPNFGTRNFCFCGCLSAEPFRFLNEDNNNG